MRHPHARSRPRRRGTGPAPRQRGFSLIEIIIVVVLIAAIVAFAASRILGGSDRAKVNLARSQLETLAQKVQSYEMDTGVLPGQLDDLVTDPGAVGWLGPYAKANELNDPWNEPIRYDVPGEAGPFGLLSLGADRQPGGESVDADIRYE
jgi:general secretion pathway protein G